jgi:GPH family glycoside/pentoside/hexuronide:cation symporter
MMVDLSVLEGKVAPGKKIAYGVGEFADACLYTVFYTYFLFFLTDIAHIPPVFAGTISMIGVLWDAFTDPLIGSISDTTRMAAGRRRPFMFAAALPLAASIWLLFTVLDLPPSVAKFYYVVTVLLFFTCFTLYFIPYSALAAEMSRDYNERTSIQSYKGIWIAIGTIIGGGTPMLLVEYLNAANGSSTAAWSLMALTMGGVSALAILISWAGTRGAEPVNQPDIEKPHGNRIWSGYRAIGSNRPLRFAIGIYLSAIIGNTLYGTTIIYFMTYYMGFDKLTISMLFAVSMGSGAVFSPLINIVARKLGKRYTFIAFMTLFSAEVLTLLMVKPGQLGILVFLSVLSGVSLIAMWILSWGLIADVVEVDEWQTGQRREGLHFGFAHFVQKIGAATTFAVSGSTLAAFGYVPKVEQTDTALLGIRLTCSVFTALPTLLAVILCWFHPMTGRRHRCLREALAARREGKGYSTEGFKAVL